MRARAKLGKTHSCFDCFVIIASAHCVCLQAGKAGVPQMHIASFMAVILAEEYPKPCGEEMRMERKCASCPESYFRIHMQLEVAAYSNMWRKPITTGELFCKLKVSYFTSIKGRI